MFSIISKFIVLFLIVNGIVFCSYLLYIMFKEVIKVISHYFERIICRSLKFS